MFFETLVIPGRKDLKRSTGSTKSFGTNTFLFRYFPKASIPRYKRIWPRFLISSDAVWDGDLGVLTIRVEGSISPFLALSSLEKLSTLEADRIYPGHGSPIKEAEAAIKRCRKKLEGFLRDPSRIGRDQLRKIFIYILLMSRGFPVREFFDYLMKTYWYRETVEFFFEGHYERTSAQTMESLIQKGVVQIEGERYLTTVKA